MASNAGSVSTITGNPQNMIVGALSKIPYGEFAFALSPVAAVSLLLCFVLIAVSHPGEFLTRDRLTAGEDPREARYHRPLVIKSVLTVIGMVALFFLGYPVAGVAILGGAFLLFTRRVKAEKVYFDIDWPLLVMFVGLFIVVAGLERAVIGAEAVTAVGRLDLNHTPVLAAA